MPNYDDENERIQVPRFEEAAGFYTSKKRSVQMSKIRSRNSKPELILRKALWSKNVRFRLHDRSLPGTPDIVIKKYKLAIFVDGEFWHGFDWKNKRETINQIAYSGSLRSNVTCKRISVSIKPCGIWTMSYSGSGHRTFLKTFLKL